MLRQSQVLPPPVLCYNTETHQSAYFPTHPFLRRQSILSVAFVWDAGTTEKCQIRLLTMITIIAN